MRVPPYFLHRDFTGSTLQSAGTELFRGAADKNMQNSRCICHWLPWPKVL